MRRSPRLLPWALAIALVGCVGVGASPSGWPRTDAAPAPKSSSQSRPIDAGQAQRLQQVMVPLIKGMNRPLPLDKVRVGLADDDHINAANAGSGQFIVTRGLLERANDNQLRGVIAHELAHEDLGHGAEILQRAGYPRAIMPDTLTWLTQVEGGSSGGFFTTHPATAERIEALRRMR